MRDQEKQKTIEQIKQLDEQIEKLRETLNLADKKEVLYQDQTWNKVVIVEADGYGGADLLIGDGFYPLRFSVKESTHYDDEAAAIEAAKLQIDCEVTF